MGGLWKDLRGTAVLFLVGAVALAGIPPFAGFFSKDAILAAVWVAGHGDGAFVVVFWMLAICAAMTAFYTTRLCWFVFFAPEAAPSHGHGGHDAHHGHAAHRHLHHPDLTMLLPLAVLALLSVVGGALAEPMRALLDPVVGGHGHVDHDVEHAAHGFAMAVSLAAAGSGVLAGVLLYTRGSAARGAFVHGPGAALVAAARGKFFVDEAYAALVVRPIGALAGLLFTALDRALIDRALVEGSGDSAMALGAVLRRTQTGVINLAAAAMAGGALLAIGWALLAGAT
jgi:NADH-quinone oxidoreductase subunit L